MLSARAESVPPALVVVNDSVRGARHRNLSLADREDDIRAALELTGSVRSSR